MSSNVVLCLYLSENPPKRRRTQKKEKKARKMVEMIRIFSILVLKLTLESTCVSFRYGTDVIRGLSALNV